MPTLLQINVCNNVLSTGKIASDIGELAIKNGWTSYIAYARGYKESNNIPIKIGNTFDVKFHAIEQRLFDNTGLGLGSYFATKNLIKQIKQKSPDIIHLHILVGYYIHLDVLFKYLATLDIPIVWTIHSCWEFTGHCGFFDTINCEKWKTGCHHCPQLKSYPSSLFIDRSRTNYLRKKELFTSLKNVTLVPVSQWLAGLLEQSFLGVYPIKPIYNGISVDRFCPSENVNTIRQKFCPNDEFLAIGVASTWEPRKNLRDYVALSRKLPQGYKLLLIGLSKKQIDELPDGMIGLERTTDFQELVDLYAAADVVLNLSLEETFGLTTVEGFACGTPSIVYNKTASPELVSDETGFIVEAGDIDGILRCMSVIKKDGKDRYSKVCIARASTSFNKDANFKEYINLYNTLLTNNKI